MLETRPLHQSCKLFENGRPRAEDESFEDYVSRCERDVAKYFMSMPTRLREKYKDKDSATSYMPKIWESHITCATDQKLFKDIVYKVCRVMQKIIKNQINKSGF